MDFENTERLAMIKDIPTSRLLEIAVAERDGRLALIPINKPYNARLEQVRYLLGVFIKELANGIWDSKVASRIAELTSEESQAAKLAKEAGA